MEENVKILSKVESVKQKLEDEENIFNLSEFFKVIGDSTRTKILYCLEKEDLLVGEIAEILGMSLSAVSHQLCVLKKAKLVSHKKLGKEVRYSLSDFHVISILESAMDHVLGKNCNSRR